MTTRDSICRICMVEFESVALGVSRATADERARLRGTDEQQRWLRQVLRDWQHSVLADPVCQRGQYFDDVSARFAVLLAHVSVAAGLLEDEHVDVWASGYLPAVVKP